MQRARRELHHRDTEDTKLREGRKIGASDVDCLIQKIEKLSTVVKIDALPQSAPFLAHRQLANRFAAAC